jgi:hypothetical protein
MTTKSTSELVSVTVGKGETAQTITVPLEDTTELLQALLDARKKGYAARRAEKAKAASARKAKATTKKADRIKRLKAQLAALEA